MQTATIDRLKAKFGDSEIGLSEFRDNKRVHIQSNQLSPVLRFLKADCGFDMLADLAGIDYLQYPNAVNRYGLVYALTNTATGERVFIKVGLDDPEPKIDSVYSLWLGADWMEREVYDMFGVVFEGHPDLRRILCPEGFVSYPLRKDYPLRGKGERHNFATVTRAEG
jgi:NADH-quinone oxidoreductase subunit C